MNTPLDPNSETSLLEAVLQDEEWQTTHTTVKRAALASLQTRRRRRQFHLWGGSLMGLIVVAAITVRIMPFGGKEASITPPPQAKASTPASAEQYLSDEELLSLFPKGSCVLAEINGRKQLVFFDGEIEANGVGMQRAP